MPDVVTDNAMGTQRDCGDVKCVMAIAVVRSKTPFNVECD